MSKQVIEYGGLPVGILIPNDGKLRFLAVKFHVMDLDGQQFSSPGAVRRAIGDLIAGRSLAGQGF